MREAGILAPNVNWHSALQRFHQIELFERDLGKNSIRRIGSDHNRIEKTARKFGGTDSVTEIPAGSYYTQFLVKQIGTFDQSLLAFDALLSLR